MIRVGVVGYGYWGPNLLRNVADASAGEAAGVSDGDPDRLSAAVRRYPSATPFPDALELIRSPQIDAVIIATPLATHFELALEALRAGKHTLVEKPLCASSHEAELLIEEAARRHLIPMVDHTFVFGGAVRRMKEEVDSGRLGRLYYYDSVRVNLGLFRHDINVLWDLASHDLSIMDDVLPYRPLALATVGARHVPDNQENVAYLTLFFENDFIGHIGVNWLSPVKVRQTLLGGSEKMIVYDDLQTSEKIKIYDKGVTLDEGVSLENVRRVLVGYRTGDMLAPQLDRTEPLHRLMAEFFSSIEDGSAPVSDGEAGLRVVRVLEAATTSLKQGGRPVELG